jgi:hypothetical protein
MLILILLVAALMLTLLALADFPRGCRPHFTCVALLLVIVLLFVGHYAK